MALVAAALAVCAPTAMAESGKPVSQREGNNVRATRDQMRQFEIVKVEPYAFRVQKFAVGRLAYNEDVSTLILTPFSGRVVRLIAKIGDVVKRDRKSVV